MGIIIVDYVLEIWIDPNMLKKAGLKVKYPEK